MKKSYLLVSVLGVALTASSSFAALITNGSFETNNVGVGNYRYGGGLIVPGHDGVVAAPWNFDGGTGVTFQNTPGGSTWGGNAYDGEYYAFVQTGSVGITNSIVSQGLTGLSALATYTLSFATQTRNWGGSTPNQLDVYFGGSFLFSVNNTTPNSWTTHTFNFSSAATSGLLEFRGFGLTATDSATMIDDVVVAQAVPEPFTMALLGGGALAGFARLRKRKQA